MWQQGFFWGVISMDKWTVKFIYQIKHHHLFSSFWRSLSSFLCLFLFSCYFKIVDHLSKEHHVLLVILQGISSRIYVLMQTFSICEKELLCSSKFKHSAVQELITPLFFPRIRLNVNTLWSHNKVFHRDGIACAIYSTRLWGCVCHYISDTKQIKTCISMGTVMCAKYCP